MKALGIDVAVQMPSALLTILQTGTCGKVLVLAVYVEVVGACEEFLRRLNIVDYEVHLGLLA